MEIKVLGPGCPNCQDLERRVKKALEELGLSVSVTKVTDFAEIGKYIMLTPGVVINEKVKHEGLKVKVNSIVKARLFSIQ